MLNYAIAPASARSRTRIGPKFAVAFASLANVFGRWLRKRRTMLELRSLDDRMLKDIGLHRSEIEIAAFNAMQERIRTFGHPDEHRLGR